jgi:hypothetical protein
MQAVGTIKLLLGRASTVILGSESRGTHDNILLSHDFGTVDLAGLNSVVTKNVQLFIATAARA